MGRVREWLLNNIVCTGRYKGCLLHRTDSLLYVFAQQIDVKCEIKLTHPFGKNAFCMTTTVKLNNANNI